MRPGWVSKTQIEGMTFFPTLKFFTRTLEGFCKGKLRGFGKGRAPEPSDQHEDDACVPAVEINPDGKTELPNINNQ